MRWLLLLSAFATCEGEPLERRSPGEVRFVLEPLRVLVGGRVRFATDAEGAVRAGSGDLIGRVSTSGRYHDLASGVVLQLEPSGSLRGPSGPLRGWSVGQQSAEAGERLISVDPRGRIAEGESVVARVVGADDVPARRLALFVWVAMAAVGEANAVDREAEAMLEAIFGRLRRYVEGQRMMPDGSVVQGRLPPSAPRTPGGAPCGAERRAWPEEAPRWSEIGVRPELGVRNAYELEVGNGAVVIRAYGDRDCDGEPTVFELHGRLQGGTLVREGELRRIAPEE